jgi:hypothetical protein
MIIFNASDVNRKVSPAHPLFFPPFIRAWVNPSPRLHQARLRMDNNTLPLQTSNSSLSWK